MTRKPELIEDVSLNIALINCRSLKPKIKSLTECFNMNKLDVSILNETWMYKNDSQMKKILSDLLTQEKIGMIRKDRDSRGGGVAIAFDTSKITLKKLNLESLKNKKKLEIVAARGKLRNYKKSVTVFSCYLPPKYSKAESIEFMETLSDAIGEAKSADEGWVVLGGDWNHRPLELALDMYPDIKELITPPTRKNSTLDILATNFNSFVKTAIVTHPLEGEKDGVKSDHKIIITEALLPRPKAFTWEVHEYLQITQAGTDKFTTKLNELNWSQLRAAWPDQNKMTEIFHETLSDLVDSCFCWKRVRRKSTDKPWISDALRHRMKIRLAVFRNEGRSELWKRLDKGIKETIKFRKRKYEEDMSAKLASTGKSNQWYNIYRNLISDDMPRRWHITELNPGQEPKSLANDLAQHFSRITNTGKPLSQADIPRSTKGPGLIPQMQESQVEKILREFKKCNSRVTGDIPKQLINPCSKKLSEALTLIYNASFLNKAWPDRWKEETIIPIPKTQSPGSPDDIRPISMTTLWSKVLESLVANFTLEESLGNWKNDQYGGRKGSSTNHVLVEIWDRVLTNLENGSKSVVLSAIDFSKSFSRCRYQEILQAYKNLGLTDWCIEMHAAFLKSRTMCVKIGNVLSDPMPVTGGAVQGSVLGVMDHNAVLEGLNDNIEQAMFKYVDDLTMIEPIDPSVPCLIETEQNGQTTHIFRPSVTQESFDSLTEQCQERGLKINDKKTQLLTISSAKNHNISWLKLHDGSALKSAEELKLLGFVFSEQPNVHKQVENIINRAASRSFVLRRLSGVNTDKLKSVYCSIIRSVLEYSNVTFGPMLTKYEKNNLERVQKRCLKTIYGHNKTYQDLLNLSGLEKLEERRNRAVLKFARKASNNPQFSHWFPLNKNRTSQRNKKIFEEKRARTDRLYKSPLYTMRRMLNETPENLPNNNPIYSDLSYLFNAP